MKLVKLCGMSCVWYIWLALIRLKLHIGPNRFLKNFKNFIWLIKIDTGWIVMCNFKFCAYKLGSFSIPFVVC